MQKEQKFKFVHTPQRCVDSLRAPFNIASEEYLLERTTDSYIYFWRNESAVIVGKNQNTLQEVDLEYTDSHGIEVVRRMSGGGAVYHDLGNICYTVIAPYDKNIDTYREFSSPLIEYLNKIGIPATFSGRNDIEVDGYKVSGNAERIYRDRVMHHGTLLFDTDLTVLEKALIPSPLKLKSKGIKSVRARVKNIKQLCGREETSEQFFSALCAHFSSMYQTKEFDDDEINEIRTLAKDKYSTYDWNVGESPKAQFIRAVRFDYGIVELAFDLIDGQISGARIGGDFFELGQISEMEAKLEGVKPTRECLKRALKDVSGYIRGAEVEQFIEKIFFSGESL